MSAGQAVFSGGERPGSPRALIVHIPDTKLPPDFLHLPLGLIGAFRQVLQQFKELRRLAHKESHGR